MCFVVKNEKPEPKIADKDIICYKQVKLLYNKHDGNWLRYAWNKYFRFKSTFTSEYSYCKYKLKIQQPNVNLILRMYTYPEGWIKVNNSNIIKTTNMYEIHEGYHSYKSISSLRKHKLLVTVVCTIPKGTTYYENESYYVSETIILNSKYK